MSLSTSQLDIRAGVGTRPDSPDHVPGLDAPERPRFLSEADCHDIASRLARFAMGGGYTSVAIVSTWTGNVRWARNQISTSGDVQDNTITVHRNINGASGRMQVNDTTDAVLVAAARCAERLAGLHREKPNSDLVARLPLEPGSNPSLFSDATYQLDADQRAAAAIMLARQAADVGLLSAGYIEVTAVGMGLLDTLGRVRYFAYTQARYSVTVRDTHAMGSGWAGVDWYDWHKIDAPALTARALDKCLKSRNPVAIEPGRYTTILEPQAVSDFVGPLIRGRLVETPLDRGVNEGGSPPGPFHKSQSAGPLGGYAKFGERVVDERITISADPMDPDLGFAPFETMGHYTEGDDFVIPVYHPATWIDHGILVNLAYDRFSNIASNPQLGRDADLGMPNSGAFRMSGGDTSIEEMIATTKRGVLVTRFDQVVQLHFTSQLYRGYTRDGLWLIENGKISKAVKNMTFTESILIALNNLEQLGPAQRAFHPSVWPSAMVPQPTVVPFLKIRDFSFTALADAI